MKPNLILFGLSSLLFTGCGFLLTNGPPTGHEQMDSFSCTEQDAGPILDAVVAGATGVVPPPAAPKPEWDDQSPPTIQGGVAWGVGSRVSPGNSVMKAKRQRACYPAAC